MSDEQQDPKDLDEAWNDFLKAKSVGFSARTAARIFDVSESAVRRVAAGEAR
ncbi:hypothetical protein [Bifidobacterium ruminantium]|uniref:hypothetical protein n=1 Tax=Bifidobacterium ruminantium TaxID=78346 RepID=UPI0024936306|nr:hypothetical protein [Bifidobacterium ruminantium]